ncbi:MAG: tetratricopeptide repeat protein, partial [Vicinamibacteria bacterium]
RRFRTERQILASIEHPNIARLLDGGSTEDGLPYIVMEYVDGTPIDAYCDTHRLTIEERLRLFQSVCAAVHFAHQNLVVHRDLKPANVLVTSESVPKLLDFGIAKLLNPEFGAAALEPTRTNSRMMTPEYASPEQVRGETVTTASDVYSLGVLLYELLTGHRPYRVRNRPLHEVERAICEDEPTPPSAVVGLVEELPGDAPAITPDGVSSARASTASRLRRRLEGDLDNICLMAMRKERQRRYGSVEQLSEDIGRALEGLPVKARRPTLAYRSSKFVRRHKVGVAAALLFLVSMLTFSVLLFRERNRAQSEAAKVAAINRFLQQTLRSADPVDGLAHDVTVAEALDEAAGKIETSFPDEPEIRAELQFTIGASYYRLGKYDQALSLLRSSAETLEKTVGSDDPNLANVLESLSHVRNAQGDTAEAVSLLERTLAIREKAYGSLDPSVADALTNLGGTYRDHGEYAKAEKALQRALEITERILGPDHPEVVSTLTNLGGLYAYQGRYAEAEPLFRRALEIAEKALGPDHASVATILSNLGAVLVDQGEYEKAESVLLRAVSVGEKAWGPEHPSVATTMTNLGGLYLKGGRYDEAETLLERSLQIVEKNSGPRHLSVATALNNLAGLYLERGRHSDAEPLYWRALEIVEDALGPRDLFFGLLLNNL